MEMKPGFRQSTPPTEYNGKALCPGLMAVLFGQCPEERFPPSSPYPFFDAFTNSIMGRRSSSNMPGRFIISSGG